jgi:hypothetical protein
MSEQNHEEHEIIPGYKAALFIVTIVSIAYLVFAFVM